MPVEIRELIIRAVVATEEDSAAEAMAAAGLSAEEREAIIAESVKQVLRILRKSQER